MTLGRPKYHTAEPLVPAHSAFEVQMATEISKDIIYQVLISLQTKWAKLKQELE